MAEAISMLVIDTRPLSLAFRKWRDVAPFGYIFTPYGDLVLKVCSQ